MNEAPLTFGPWADGITPNERRVQCETMRALVFCIVPAAVDLRNALRAAGRDGEALPRAGDLLMQLPALSRRRLLANYMAMAR